MDGIPRAAHGLQRQQIYGGEKLESKLGHSDFALGDAATAIVCPGKYAAETNLMEVTISDAGGRQTTLNVPVNAFLTDTGLEAGKHYSFSLKVGKDVVGISNVTVEDWDNKEIDGGVAEEVTPTID